MNLTTTHLAWLIATIPVLALMAKMFWNVAEFAISAKTDIKTLTSTVTKIEEKLEDGIHSLEIRVSTLERHEHKGE